MGDWQKNPEIKIQMHPRKRRMEMSHSDAVKEVTSFTTNISKEWNAMTAEHKMQYRHDAELGKAILEKYD